MPIVIKKRVSLDFLGDEYKDSYLTLRSISVGDFEKLGDKTVKQTVIDRFIEGKIQQDEGLINVTKDNIEELPGEVFVEAFGVISGNIDPKSKGLSTMLSSTDTQPQKN